MIFIGLTCDACKNEFKESEQVLLIRSGSVLVVGCPAPSMQEEGPAIVIHADCNDDNIGSLLFDKAIKEK